MVEWFWHYISFGLLGYDMSRSQSGMRVATTASPVSGSEVRERVADLAEEVTLLLRIPACSFFAYQPALRPLTPL